MLGITRTVPNENMLKKMAAQMKNYNISSCVIAGGREVVINVQFYKYVALLSEYRYVIFTGLKDWSCHV